MMLFLSAQTSCCLSYGSQIPIVPVVVAAVVLVAGVAPVEAGAGVAVGLREAEEAAEVVALQDEAVVEEEGSLVEHVVHLGVVVEDVVVVEGDDFKHVPRLPSNLLTVIRFMFNDNITFYKQNV
jgi:enamine deaminase RidA (YjgF/YER057c/UK114 family)